MVRPCMFGQCFLCKLRMPVRPFSVCSALPSQSTMSGSDALMVIEPPCYVLGVLYLTLSPQEPGGPPKFLSPLFTHTTLFVDPGRPSGISPKRSLWVGFWCVQTIAVCIIAITGLSQALESAVPPAVSVVPCVRFTCVVRLSPPRQVQHSV